MHIVLVCLRNKSLTSPLPLIKGVSLEALEALKKISQNQGKYFKQSQIQVSFTCTLVFNKYWAVYDER